jgi:hypothetical protein
MLRDTPQVVSRAGTLVVEVVQPAGGREMAGADYLRGHREVLGTAVARAATVGDR